MSKKYFDKNGREIKAGMTIYSGNKISGSCVPVVLHEGCLCLDFCFGCANYVPLSAVDLSNSIVCYDPEEET